jgi:hypothetical protein
MAALKLLSCVTGDAPLHQLLGSDSLAIAGGVLRALAAEVERGRGLAVTTDIPNA